MPDLEDDFEDLEDVIPLRGGIATQAHQLILQAIVDGKITSGDVLDEEHWADMIGVPQRPVREAIQRLRDFGLLDMSSGKHLCVLSYTRSTARQEARDWTEMQQIVIETMLPMVTAGMLDRMRASRDRCRQNREDDPGQASVANFDFFQILRNASPSFGLRLGASATAYRLRLAEPFLPNHMPAMTALHNGIITSLDRGTQDIAFRALARWARAVTRSTHGAAH